MEATIDELETEIKTDQNKWLRLQCNIVSMSEKLTQLLNDSHLARQRMCSTITLKSVTFLSNKFLSFFFSISEKPNRIVSD